MKKEEYLSLISAKFDYLCKDFGFIQNNPYPYMVVYATSKYEINLGYDCGRSFEISCHISEINRTHSYTLQEILRIKDNPKASGYAFFQTTNIEKLKEALDDISGVIKNDILNILKEEGIFLRLKHQQEKDCKEYELKSRAF